jgi:hypothetical protein
MKPQEERRGLAVRLDSHVVLALLAHVQEQGREKVRAVEDMRRQGIEAVQAVEERLGREQRAADIESGMLTAERNQARAERDALARQLDDVHTALAEANVPRADAVDEPLYSEAHRVRLLYGERDALVRALQLHHEVGPCPTEDGPCPACGAALASTPEIAPEGRAEERGG